MMILVKRPFIVPRDPGPESGVDKEGVSGCCFRLRGRSTTRQHKHKHAAQAEAQGSAQPLHRDRWQQCGSGGHCPSGQTVALCALRDQMADTCRCRRHLPETQRMAWPQVGTGRQTRRPHDRSRHSRNQRECPEAETEMTNVRLNMSSSVALKPVIHQTNKSCGSIF